MIINTMGVLNITPDSFSDGGELTTSDQLTKRLQEVMLWSEIVDIGAESTAPMNQAVSSKGELARFEKILYPLLETFPDPQVKISIDTYKINVFKEVASKVHKAWPDSEIIFNDISGVLDAELIMFLKDFDLPFTYIYSHNLCPRRENIQNHMDYQSPKKDLEFVSELVAYFNHGLEKLKETKRAVYIDPCFGFSKSREQNHALLKYFKTFLLQTPFDVPCVLGISRKSFLRFPMDLDVKDPVNLKVLEQMHSILYFDLIKEPGQRELIIRSHEPHSLVAAKNIKKMFDL